VKKTTPAGSSRKTTVADVKRRIPKTATVTIRLPLGLATTLATVMKSITTNVDLKDLEIQVLDNRVSKVGRVTLVVRKEDKAVLLAEKVKIAVGEDATINRPVITIPVLLLNVPN